MTKFELALLDVCEGYIGREMGWAEYIRACAKSLLKLAKEENDGETES